RTNDEGWQTALKKGLVAGSAFARVTEHFSLDAAAAHLRIAAIASPEHAIEINFRPSATVHDGRFSDNGWLLELPQPITKVTWDNVARLSAKTAEKINVSDGDLVEIAVDDRAITIPALIVPGDVDDAIGLDLGWGKRASASLANGVGVDVYPL